MLFILQLLYFHFYILYTYTHSIVVRDTRNLISGNMKGGDNYFEDGKKAQLMIEARFKVTLSNVPNFRWQD